MRLTTSATARRLGSGLALVSILASGLSVAAESPGASIIPSSSPSVAPSARISYPQGTTDVVLQMDTGGGYVPFTYGLTQAPEFTLYGDGTVVFRPAADPEGNGFPPYAQAALTAEQVDALLAYALGPGGLAEARDRYDHRQITDMPTTLFTIRTTEVDKSVAVYALAMTRPGGTDAAAYESFQSLGELLTHFGVNAVTGELQDVQLFQPQQYRAFLAPATDPGTTAIAWPWPDLTLADFRPFGNYEDMLIGGLTSEQVAQVTTVPSGGEPAVAILGPDGAPLTLTIRPLLPGEVLDPLAPIVD